MAERDHQLGHRRAQQGGQTLFMGGVGVAVEKTDRDGIDPKRAQLGHQGRNPRLIQRCAFLALGVDAAPQWSAHGWRGTIRSGFSISIAYWS